MLRAPSVHSHLLRGPSAHSHLLRGPAHLLLQSIGKSWGSPRCEDFRRQWRRFSSGFTQSTVQISALRKDSCSFGSLSSMRVTSLKTGLLARNLPVFNSPFFRIVLSVLLFLYNVFNKYKCEKCGIEYEIENSVINGKYAFKPFYEHASRFKSIA